VLSSPAFDDVDACSESNPAACDAFPEENISFMESPNISPELDWEGAPAGTRSFAITFADLSFGQPHWAIWNIPAAATMLPADIAKDTTLPALPAGAVQTNATFAEGDGYFGPQAACNVYRFELYALSLEAFSPTEPEFVVLVRDELDALGDAILGRATLTARANYMMTCE
jgi:Raf kinase inhibitor-like YbhB/YbcL family protein